MPDRYMVHFLVAVSIFGLAVPLILVSTTQPTQAQRPSRVAGAAFTSICLLGVLATRFPRRCSFLAGMRPHSRERGQATGHHAECAGFSAHVFTLFGTRRCLGCTGLLIGGLVALFASILYFFLGFGFPGDTALRIYLGVILVGLAILHFSMLGSTLRAVRLVANAAFPLGAFLVLAAIDQRFSSVEIDVLILLTIAFWLVTRIYLSTYSHDKICNRCTVAECLSKPDSMSAPGS